jgi:hypothetical protein
VAVGAVGQCMDEGCLMNTRGSIVLTLSEACRMLS